VGIRTNKPEILERLDQLLPPGWKPADSPVVERLYSLLISKGAPRPGLRRFHLLYGDAEVVGRESNLDSIFEVLRIEPATLCRGTRSAPDLHPRRRRGMAGLRGRDPGAKLLG